MTKLKCGGEALDAIKLAYSADRPVLLEGSTGIGKSAIVEQAAGELGIGFLARDLSLMEACDLSGMPVIEAKKMYYAAPAFLPIDGKGLLVFEELNRCEKHVRAPALELLTRRVLNDYKLPAGWLPVACVNPTDGYDVDELDPALKARFSVLRIEPDVTSWLQWAETAGVHHAVYDYVRATPKIFETPGSNPRAWFYIGEIMKKFEAGAFAKLSLLTLIEGYVGDKLAIAFLKAYELGTAAQIPTAEQLLRNYERYRELVRAFGKNGNTTALDSICHQMLLHLQDPSRLHSVIGNTRRSTNLIALYTDLPAEFRLKMRTHHPKVFIEKERP